MRVFALDTKCWNRKCNVRVREISNEMSNTSANRSINLIQGWQIWIDLSGAYLRRECYSQSVRRIEIGSVVALCIVSSWTRLVAAVHESSPFVVAAELIASVRPTINCKQVVRSIVSCATHHSIYYSTPTDIRECEWHSFL